MGGGGGGGRAGERRELWPQRASELEDFARPELEASFAKAGTSRDLMADHWSPTATGFYDVCVLQVLQASLEGADGAEHEEGEQERSTREQNQVLQGL